MTFPACLCFLALLPLAGRAQGYAEGIALSYEVLPLQVAGSAEHFRADVYRANLTVPVNLRADSARALLLGLGLEALQFGAGPAGLPGAAVYGLAPVLGYRWRVSPRTEVLALALPGLYSDLRQVQGRDLRYGGVGRLTHRHSARFASRLTLGYRQQFYGPQYVLLLGLDWQPGPRWRVFGDLPTAFTISYTVRPGFNAGFNLIGLNSSYRLSDQNQYLQYQQAHYGLFAEGYLSRHWALRGTVAYAGTLRIATYAEGDQWPATLDYIGLGHAPTALSPALAKGVAFKLGLSYRVVTK